MAWRKHLFVLIGCTTAWISLGGALAGTASAAGNYDLRGEWSVAASATHEPTTSGVCVIATMEVASGTFSGACKFDGGVLSGTISGTTTATSASVTIALGAVGVSFIVPSATIETASSPPTLSGAGTYSGAGFSGETGSLSMARTATYEEVQAREARELKARQEKEAEEREIKEKEALQLKERQEAEAKERERQETETRAGEAREAKERLERAAREIAEKNAVPKSVVTAPVVTLASVEPVAKALAESRSGSLSVGFSSPNTVAVTGHFTLTGKAAGKHVLKLGGATFAIAADGDESVKLKLSSGAIALLKHHAKLAATLIIVTEASGATPVTKTYGVALTAPRGGKRKG